MNNIYFIFQLSHILSETGPVAERRGAILPARRTAGRRARTGYELPARKDKRSGTGVNR